MAHISDRPSADGSQNDVPTPHTRRPVRGRRVTTAIAAVTFLLSPLAFSAHAADAAAPTGRILGAGAPDAVSGSYIVSLKPGRGLTARSDAGRELARKYGATIRHTYGSALNGYSVRLSEAQAKRLAADPAVASVSQDARVRIAAAQPDPPSWGLDRIDQSDLPLDDSYTPPAGGGSGVTAYVIDAGVSTGHQDFGGRASSGWDFVDGDADAQDGHGHGTHVAGTIAGTSHGVAKQADVVGVRVLDDEGSGTIAQVIAGIDWVAKNAEKPAVANMSLGGILNAQLDDAVRGAIASGVTFTVAAGNNGLPTLLFSPARVTEAITVGATDRTDARASFSNWGPGVDVFAPGVDITSAWHTSGSATNTISGTSMAAPHAAGAAALHLDDHPADAPAAVEKALTDGAAQGRISGAGLGSPNRLLQVGD
ncbi:S8 family peptidase [Streptomyces sp. S07_1.15]|uniref:S8 family peptidase n=1 Tax=Streptomyces sp. S07_1.15 TaxID=2873925 RepID=UPI001D13B74B|nr:S8 family peptidase [Streptomyces sp. S07_1.15]MCC3651589.1 S8 family peptidase [Streptomyces sp. S07_1.15]